MNFEPVSEEVSVKRMMIYSCIPILDLYVLWRIENFWYLIIVVSTGLLFSVLSFISSLLFLDITDYQYFITAIGITSGLMSNVLLVRCYAKRYNEKLLL